MPKANDLTGERYGRFVVVGRSGSTNSGHALWLCRCDCGQERTVLASNLRSGRTVSCGCFKVETRTKVQGNRHPKWKGGRRVENGYVVLSNADYPGAKPFNKTAEHVVVMARHLGRPLRPGESVHHKNGIRGDNRIENLELWTKRQPNGQRVEDMVVWAKQLLVEYAPELLADTAKEDVA